MFKIESVLLETGHAPLPKYFHMEITIHVGECGGASMSKLHAF